MYHIQRARHLRQIQPEFLLVELTVSCNSLKRSHFSQVKIDLFANTDGPFMA